MINHNGEYVEVKPIVHKIIDVFRLFLPTNCALLFYISSKNWYFLIIIINIIIVFILLI